MNARLLYHAVSRLEHQRNDSGILSEYDGKSLLTQTKIYLPLLPPKLIIRELDGEYRYLSPT